MTDFSGLSHLRLKDRSLLGKATLLLHRHELLDVVFRGRRFRILLHEVRLTVELKYLLAQEVLRLVPVRLDRRLDTVCKISLINHGCCTFIIEY